MFYVDNIKIIPRNLNEYLTPLALATLFLSFNDKCEKAILGKKDILDSSLVLVEDLNYLSLVLKDIFNIETSVDFNNRSGLNGGSLYIKNISAFSKIVKPHILHSQYY